MPTSCADRQSEYFSGSMFNSMDDLIAGMRSNLAAQPLRSEDLAGPGRHHNQLDHDSGEDDSQLGSSRRHAP